MIGRRPGRGGGLRASGMLLLAGCAADASVAPMVPALTIHEEVRVGLPTPELPEGLGRVISAATTDEGDLWVYDRLAQAVIRFNAEGSVLGPVGREGAGPGEFRGNVFLAWHPPRRQVVALDARNARLTWFSADGHLVETWPAPPRTEAGGLEVDDGGRVWVRVGMPLPEGGPPGPLSELPRAWAGFSDQGHPADTVPIPAPDLVIDAYFLVHSPGGPVVPWPEETMATLDHAGRLVFGRNTEYTLHRRDATGAELDPLTLEWPRSPVPAAEAEQMRRINPTEGAIPDRKPVFHHLLRDADGRIWVRIHVDAIERPPPPPGTQPPSVHLLEPLVYHRWDQEGRLEGEIRFPAVGRWLHATGDKAWVLETSALGEQEVVRYRIGAHGPSDR